MRVLLVSNLYPPDVLGGYELLARDLAKSLSARGHDITVLTTGSGGVEREGETIYRTLRLSRPFGSAPRSDRLRHLAAAAHNRLAVRRFLREGPRPDVVLGMSQRRLGLSPLRALGEAKIPIVLTVNDDWPAAYCPPPARGMLGPLRALVDHHLLATKTFRGLSIAQVIYLSDAVRRSALGAGAPLPAGLVEPQGVDLSVFSPRAPRPMRAAPAILVTGRLHPSKAPEAAIDALGELARRGVEAALTFAGEASDPAYAAGLRERAEAQRIASRITWLGKVAREALPDLYRGADVLFFASLLEHEGQGLTYLEAMACGLPVIASPSGGAREFLDRHPIARRAARCDGPAFADELQALLADPDAAQDLVRRALDAVRAHASLDAYVGAVERELTAAARAAGVSRVTGAR